MLEGGGGREERREGWREEGREGGREGEGRTQHWSGRRGERKEEW